MSAPTGRKTRRIWLVSIAIAAFLGTNTLVAKVAWTGTYCEGGSYPTGICWPDGAWDSATVSSAQMSQSGVDDLHNFLIGTAKRDRYVLIRNGQIVRRYGSTTSRKNCGSECKFIISTMLMFARKEGLIDGLTTEAAYDKKLKDYSSFAGLDTGDGDFDSTITFNHVANQMSGYALAGEGPTKWAYNDLGMNLFWKALHKHVFTTEFNKGTGLAGATDTRLANPLQFQNSGTATGKLFTSKKKKYGDQKNNTESDDAFCTGTGWKTDGVDDTATADNPNPPACRGLYGYSSVEDLARVLYFWLRKGKWKSSQLLPASYFPTEGGTITGALSVSTLGLRTDLCSGVPCDTYDYLDIQSFGTANANIDRCAEFRYFWQYGVLFNKTAKTGSPCTTGQKKYNWPNAASDAFCTNGSGGRSLHCAIPSLGLVLISTSSPKGNIVDGHIVGDATSNFSKAVEKLTKTVRTSSAGNCY